VSRERALNPESELVALVERLVDNVLARRRHRPQPPIRAMSKRQCATAANLGISTIEAAIRENELIAHKARMRTIILVDDFERWLESLPRIKPHRNAGAEPLAEGVFDDDSAPRQRLRRPEHANV
jgi:hypothetical protein